MTRKQHTSGHYQAWLKRTRRRLATSGGISQAAAVLAAESGGENCDWRTKLEALLDGSERPDIDLLIRIDSMLAKPAATQSENPAQGMLFPAAD